MELMLQIKSYKLKKEKTRIDVLLPSFHYHDISFLIHGKLESLSKAYNFRR